MDDLLCPKCKHGLSGKAGNGERGCMHGWPIAFDCECLLTEAQALRAAQRKAAALAMWKMHYNASLNIHCVGYYSALRDSGVLGENETPDELMAEYRGEYHGR